MTLQPTGITLHQESRQLQISFDDEKTFNLPYEYLRVYSPSAEVKGHFPGEEILQVGKREVGIKDVSPSGSYAINIFFDDGHETGIYTWEYLHFLGLNQLKFWEAYLQKMGAAGESRDSNK
jgi:DUF971 family protein